MTQAMPKVKICGIRTLADAQVAAQAGADFIGLVFVPSRRRRLELDVARELVEGLKGGPGGAPPVVGLFADQPLEEVNQTIETCNLDMVQLCGTESLDYCRDTKAKVIKVVHIPESPSPESKGELVQRIKAYRDSGCIVTLDRLVEGLQGGTGESFDWSIAADLAKNGNSFILAGGLSPETVSGAVTTVGPWGVDVSSGVETNGDKDHDKIRQFIANAKMLSAISGQLSDHEC
jgi:phosphoribosylanthranilate isomerase